MLILLVGAALIALAVVVVAVFVSRNLIRVPPDQALVLSGKKSIEVNPETGERRIKGHRIISGGSAFRIPMLERMDVLPLQQMAIQIDADDLRDIEGRVRSLSVLVNCRITIDQPYVERAIVRFLTMDLPDIQNIVRTTIESRVSNALLTADLAAAGAWDELQAALESAIRDDLARLGVDVDTIIFSRTPDTSPSAATVNGQHHDWIE